MNLLTDGIALGAVIPTDISRKVTIGGITKAYPVYKVRFLHTLLFFVHDIPSYTRFAHLAHFYAAFELSLSGLRTEKPRQKHSAGDRFFCIEYARRHNIPWCKGF